MAKHKATSQLKQADARANCRASLDAASAQRQELLALDPLTHDHQVMQSALKLGQAGIRYLMGHRTK